MPFTARAAEQHLTPLWTFFEEWFGPEPQPAARPHRWCYDAARALLGESADLVSTADAERRVLALENPGLPGRRLATDSLYAGLQLLMPGELARSHRHTSAALRFILEGRGAYTAVEGERAYMAPGDFIVTPAWAFHEHANETDEPTVWLDVLDVALVRFLCAGFSERYAQPHFPERAPPGDSGHRYARGLLPVGFVRTRTGSPVFSYPYSSARETLERLALSSDWDPCHGLKMQYVDPTSGGPAIPTLSTFLQLLPPGFRTAPYATTASQIVAVVEGRGCIVADVAGGEHVLDYAPRDILALPSWTPFSILAETESVLFSASDEAVQRALGLWRERRGV